MRVDVRMAEQRVVVEVHLGVERHDVASACHDQRIDLNHAGVQLVEGLIQALQQLDGGP